jgi:hypothetical protein
LNASLFLFFILVTQPTSGHLRGNRRACRHPGHIRSAGWVLARCGGTFGRSCAYLIRRSLFAVQFAHGSTRPRWLVGGEASLHASDALVAREARGSRGDGQALGEPGAGPDAAAVNVGNWPEPRLRERWVSSGAEPSAGSCLLMFVLAHRIPSPSVAGVPLSRLTQHSVAPGGYQPPVQPRATFTEMINPTQPIRLFIDVETEPGFRVIPKVRPSLSPSLSLSLSLSLRVPHPSLVRSSESAGRT